MKYKKLISLFFCWGLLPPGPFALGAESEPTPEPMTVDEVLELLAAKRPIPHGPKALTDKDLARVCTATALTELDLSDFRVISDEGIAHLSKLTELRNLNLNGCSRLTPKGLSVLPSLKHLRRLRLSRNHVKSGEIFDVILKMPSLQELILKECVAVMKKDQGLAKLKDLKNLKHLDLSCYGGHHTPIMDDVVQLIQLTYLNLDNYKGCPVSLTALKEMEKIVPRKLIFIRPENEHP